jgi:hypothetical protein
VETAGSLFPSRWQFEAHSTEVGGLDVEISNTLS